ncbi:hypothetical protein MSAN_02028600 [Mycena sanguinolenta]|uniref:Uncharacterized protein n=1 Tax=Mycena sanguinolenta TaxID=230812 RepID=A0A8H6XKI7_9AGAR|nr:hypothetical protein MSAN_02028600 [Mycena sanguinolenta]
MAPRRRSCLDRLIDIVPTSICIRVALLVPVFAPSVGAFLSVLVSSSSCLHYLPSSPSPLLPPLWLTGPVRPLPLRPPLPAARRPSHPRTRVLCSAPVPACVRRCASVSALAPPCLHAPSLSLSTRFSASPSSRIQPPTPSLIQVLIQVLLSSLATGAQSVQANGNGIRHAYVARKATEQDTRTHPGSDYGASNEDDGYNHTRPGLAAQSRPERRRTAQVGVAKDGF